MRLVEIYTSYSSENAIKRKQDIYIRELRKVPTKYILSAVDEWCAEPENQRMPRPAEIISIALKHYRKKHKKEKTFNHGDVFVIVGENGLNPYIAWNMIMLPLPEQKRYELNEYRRKNGLQEIPIFDDNMCRHVDGRVCKPIDYNGNIKNIVNDVKNNISRPITGWQDEF